MDIHTVDYAHPDAVRLIAGVQQEYVERYGGPDATPVDSADFVLPNGLFLVGYRDGEPIACGSWRAATAEGLRPGDAELKRMFVTPSFRGKGFSRDLLAELERTAFAACRTRAVLETGTLQPEAIALYRSSGYTEIPKFGIYRHTPESICFAKELNGDLRTR
ncbi:GNAT family N-acetyltransferase [Amycolatopsis sp. cg5]|uniref:GNAT family N-acetyltransferase n=1 Tax=Amycolatopsis sp. cg5 TaxID=3238802 RepID=UPI003526236B